MKVSVNVGVEVPSPVVSVSVESDGAVSVPLEANAKGFNGCCPTIAARADGDSAAKRVSIATGATRVRIDMSFLPDVSPAVPPRRPQTCCSGERLSRGDRTANDI